MPNRYGPRMDLRLLEQFVRVCEAGSLTRAAEKLACTQPALTRQMLRLERQLNTQLLVRSSRGVETTQAGARLLEHARPLLDHVGRVQAELDRMKREPAGEVSVCLPTSFHDVVTLPLISEVRRALPLVRPRVLEAMDAELREAIAAGVDIGVVMHDPERAIEGAAPIPLGEDALVLYGRPAPSRPAPASASGSSAACRSSCPRGATTCARSWRGWPAATASRSTSSWRSTPPASSPTSPAAAKAFR